MGRRGNKHKQVAVIKIFDYYNRLLGEYPLNDNGKLKYKLRLIKTRKPYERNPLKKQNLINNEENIEKNSLNKNKDEVISEVLFPTNTSELDNFPNFDFPTNMEESFNPECDNSFSDPFFY